LYQPPQDFPLSKKQVLKNSFNRVKINGMKKSGLRKIIRSITWFSAGLLILSVTSFFFLSEYIPYLLRKKIHHMVVNGSDSLYQCSMGDVSFNIWRGKISINDLHINIDSVKYHEQKSAGKLPNLTFELNMEKGLVKGLQIFPLIISKKIRIETIALDKVNIALCRQYEEKKKPAPSEEALWRIIRPTINGIYVNKVLLNGIKFIYRSSEDKKDVALAYQDCSVQLEHIRIDSMGAANASRILFTENISIQLAGLTYYTPDSLYNLRVDTFSYSSFSKKARFKNLSFKPTMDLVEFTRKNKMQIDVFEASIPELTGFNFKLERIFTDNEVCFDTMLLQKPVIKISRDRSALSDTTSQIGKYPNEALANAPFTLRIPLIQIEEAEMHYVERQKLSLKTGDIYFTKITGNITNITNLPEDIELNNHCKIDLNGFFLKSGKLHVRVDFDLASPDASYTSTADFGSISVADLNSVFIPFGNVQLNTMKLHEGHMQFKGNNTGLTGSTRLIYEQLNIEILKVDANTYQTKKQGFVSFFANLVAVRAHNLAGKSEVMANPIHVVRKIRQPFGNLLWEFLFESLKKIILKIPAKNLKAEM
jgi:hypothetical protein